MLTHLSIENFVIIEKCEVEFHTGMTIITGETGAGKSIILDAIELVLGARAEKHLIRQDAKNCHITAIFDISQHEFIQHWLAEKNLENGQECFLRRVLSDDGRSRSFINGQPVPLQLLRELGFLLVNLHGQHEHQALLSAETPREYLDAYGQHALLAEAVKKYYVAYKDIETQLQQHHAQFENRDNRLTFLEYQLKELTALHLTAESLAALEAEHKSLALLKDNIQTYHALLALLEETVMPAVYKAQHLSQPLANISTLLENARIQLEEAASEVKAATDSSEISPERLSEIDNQLSKIYDLARKHRVKPQALPALYTQLSQELKKLQDSENAIKKLEVSMQQIQRDYNAAAEKLSQARHQAAPKMAQEIEQFIHSLDMKGAKFSVALIPHTESTINLYGGEKIAFLVSANPGQPLLPLSKVASGGELSRISLAISLIAARSQSLPALIFDEVDVGIGGAAASRVGQLLKQLSEKAQVICITHQPQVAALGKHHLQVEKAIKKDKTATHIRYLSFEEKVHEIARMLGGIDITPQALSHAKELVKN